MSETTREVVVCGSLAHPELLTAAADRERAFGAAVVHVPERDDSWSEAEHAAAWRELIDHADVVAAVSKPGGTVGEATAAEVEYALRQGKWVRWHHWLRPDLECTPPPAADPDTALRDRIADAVAYQVPDWTPETIADAVMEVLSAVTAKTGPGDAVRDELGYVGGLLDNCEHYLRIAERERDEARAQLAEREAPTPASARAAALAAIEQREAVPGDPSQGPYPASVGEVADELAGLVVELDAGPARGLVRELAAMLTERQAPSREEVIRLVWQWLSDDLRQASQWWRQVQFDRKTGRLLAALHRASAR